MIDIIITSYKEPNSTLRAINSFLNQDIKDNFKIIVCDPFVEVKEFLDKNISDKRVKFFLDPGEGKSYALNILLDKLYSENKNNFIISTDGDVYTSENAVNEILAKFQDPEVGCVTGKPVSLDTRDIKYGYWSKLLYDGIDRVRKKLATEKKFLQTSGYLFAMRNGIIKEFPFEVPEDCIIPYLIWKKGYRIDYADKAEVYIKNPENWKDWQNQKMRVIKAHENIPKIAPDMPRTKSFWNEIKHGLFFSLKYPKNLKEFFWTTQLYFARFHAYSKAFQEIKKEKTFLDGWREEGEIESAKPLD